MTGDIQVYGADWCGLTRGLREYLTNSRIDYDYVDVERDDQALQFVLATNEGRRRFPVVVVQEQVVTQPTIAILRRVITEHALQPAVRTARLFTASLQESSEPEIAQVPSRISC
jgi:glutaredoxin